MRFTHSHPDKVARSLSLSGGGVRGVFTAYVLADLEELLGVNMSEQFDVVVGTSVGGLIALGLACGLKAKTIASYISNNVAEVFSQRAILNPAGMRTTRYQNTNLRGCV